MMKIKELRKALIIQKIYFKIIVKDLQIIEIQLILGKLKRLMKFCKIISNKLKR